MSSRFDEKARDWDTPDRIHRAAVVADVIVREAGPAATARVIDVGAGTGLLGLALADRVGEVVLAEPSSGMLAVTGEKVSALGDPRLRVLPFDLLADPAPEPGFDLVVSMLVLHHLPDTVAALRRVRDLLVPGGGIAIADLAEEDGTFHSDNDGIHHFGFSDGRLLDAAMAAGFADPRVVEAATLPKDGREYPLLLLLARRP